MAKRLPSPDRAALLQADRLPIVAALAAAQAIHPGEWLPAGHPAVAGIKREHGPGEPHAISDQDLATYLGAATPTHCADGWAYLSRALHSYLVGDGHTAWHLAYYAELRAAQSILSACGCGAFNYFNVVLDASGGSLALSSSSTHEMVWLALGELLQSSPSAVDTVSNAMRIYGATLPEILQHAYPGISTAVTTASWIHSWIFDLKSGASDKSFRNRCSYNPRVLTAHSSDVSESVEFVRSLWDLLEPFPTASFQQMDQQIVRSALRAVAETVVGLPTSAVPSWRVEQEMRDAYERITAAVPRFASIPVASLAKVSNPLHPLLVEARKQSPDPQSPQPVLSRAVLLLRVATGVCRQLIQDAGCPGAVDPWLTKLAIERGMLPIGGALPLQRMDFHMDCRDAADDLDKHWVSLGAGTSRFAVINSREVNTALLCQAERVVVWGLSA